MLKKITILTLLALAATGTSRAAMREYYSTIYWRESLCAACELNKFLLTNGFPALQSATGVVNTRKSDGTTPLHVAALIKSDVVIITVLLAHGADVNARNNDGVTPLQHAANNGNAEVVTILLAHGADANAKDCYGITPLHHAADMGNDAALGILLVHGADVNARDNDGNTPFDIAKHYGYTACAELLRAAQEAIN